jgi:hypothetical protein
MWYTILLVGAVSWAPFVVAAWVWSPWVIVGRFMTLVVFMILHDRGHQPAQEDDSIIVKWFRSLHDRHHAHKYLDKEPPLDGMTTDALGFVQSWVVTFSVVGFLGWMSPVWSNALLAMSFGGLLELFLQGNMHYLHHWTAARPWLPRVLVVHHRTHHLLRHTNLHAFDMLADVVYARLRRAITCS